mmetsp:Transcript_1987/g.2674  ORF Transcript_1987/g.2674 Transcript_1987/m.2674 type:complete len:84 (-) Transcript_1987:122-373(-)
MIKLNQRSFNNSVHYTESLPFDRCAFQLLLLLVNVCDLQKHRNSVFFLQSDQNGRRRSSKSIQQCIFIAYIGIDVCDMELDTS